jgi:hypothetical protein
MPRRPHPGEDCPGQAVAGLSERVKAEGIAVEVVEAERGGPAGRPHLQVQAAVRLGDGERAVGRPECGGQPGDRLTALRPKAPAAEASGLDTDASWKTVAAPIVSVFPDSRTPKPLAYTARALHGRVDSDRSQRLVALANSERKNPQASSRYSL